MEKTISINLSSQNFIIEEEAYEKLLAYLESIKRHCGAGADSAEVIADIENSMAEKLRSLLSPYKEVITMKDVESLIKIMGTIEDFDREVGSPEAESEEDGDKPKTQSTKRKLYRDTDNAVIAGVAAGLGAYFDIDPVLFRIIFCALIFAGGSAFLIYILLWIAMPEAKTAHQKLEMQGQAPTLAAFRNLAKTGKQLKEGWKKRWAKRSALGKIINLPFLIVNGLFLAIKKIWSAVWPVIRFCFGLGLAVFSFIGLGLIGVGSLFLFLYNNSSYQLYFIPIYELTALMPYVWIITAGFLSLAIPAIILLIGGLSIIRQKSLLNFTVGSILVGLWMAAGIIFCSLALRYAPELQQKFESAPLTSRSEQFVDLAGITEIEANGRLIDITVSASTSTPASLKGRRIDLDNIEIKREGNKLMLSEKPRVIDQRVCLICDLEPVRLTVATSSSLKIKTESGASVFDETKMIEEEEETPDLIIESGHKLRNNSQYYEVY